MPGSRAGRERHDAPVRICRGDAALPSAAEHEQAASRDATCSAGLDAAVPVPVPPPCRDPRRHARFFGSPAQAPTPDTTARSAPCPRPIPSSRTRRPRAVELRLRPPRRYHEGSGQQVAPSPGKLAGTRRELFRGGERDIDGAAVGWPPSREPKGGRLDPLPPLSVILAQSHDAPPSSSLPPLAA
jgi:hypothetical protein